MGLESGDRISDLNTNWPITGEDPVSEGAAHLRLIKSVLDNDVLSRVEGGTQEGDVTFEGKSTFEKESTFEGNTSFEGDSEFSGSVEVPKAENFAQAARLEQVREIGEVFCLLDNLDGVSAPDNSGELKYIKLTANDSYNDGLLGNESISGSAPLLQATAEIVDSESPLDGETVHLVNTEGRYLKPGTSPGDVANDQMQQITGNFRAAGNNFSNRNSFPTVGGSFSSRGSGTFSDGPGAAGQSNSSGSIDFDSSDSPGARTGDYTDVKHLEVTFYMRIR